MIDDSEIVKPKTDVVFKKMFADKNNKGLLIDLLASLLDMDKSSVKDVRVLNPEIVPDSVDEKFSRLDILMETKDRVIDLEMQTTDSSDFIDKEVVYLAKMICADMEKGKAYKTLRRNVSISILDFDHNKFEGSNYASLFTLYDKENNLLLTDKCAMYFFELHKLKNLNKELSKFTKKELWLKFLNSENEEEFDMIKELNNQTLNEAIDVVNSMSRDPKIREMIRQRYFAEHEKASRLLEAKEEGIEAGLVKGREEGIEAGLVRGREEGLLQGRAEERESIIANLKEMGLTDEQIQKAIKMRS